MIRWNDRIESGSGKWLDNLVDLFFPEGIVILKNLDSIVIENARSIITGKNLNIKSFPSRINFSSGDKTTDNCKNI